MLPVVTAKCWRRRCTENPSTTQRCAISGRDYICPSVVIFCMQAERATHSLDKHHDGDHEHSNKGKDGHGRDHWHEHGLVDHGDHVHEVQITPFMSKLFVPDAWNTHEL